MALKPRGSDSLVWDTGIDNTGLRKGTTQAKGILAGFAKSISAMDIFAAISIGASFAFKKAAREAYNFSRDFEHSMLEVSTISDMVANNFEGISNRIVEMSKELPDTAIGLSKALYQIASAGYAGAESFEILDESAKLAVASVTDTFTAADAITSVMNAYGDAVSGAAEVSDKLFTIVRLGKTTMRELGPDITTVTGLAAQAGITFDELAGIVAESVKTLKTPIAMTGIRGILTAIISPTEQAAEAAEELGISFNLATVQAQGFEAWMKDLINATGGSAEALSKMFPNVRGLTGLLSVMADEGDNLSKTLAEIASSAGATDAAFATMMESSVNQIKILANNVTAKLKPLGDFILEFVGDTAESINKLFGEADNYLTRFIDNSNKYREVLHKDKSAIEGMIAEIDRLRDIKNKSEDDTIALQNAEEELASYIGITADAFGDAADSVDIYTLAKQRTLELDKEIMGITREMLDAQKSLKEIEIERFNREEDESQKRLRNLQDKYNAVEKGLQQEAKNVIAARKLGITYGGQDISGTIGYEEALSGEEKAIAALVEMYKERNAGFRELEREIATETKNVTARQNLLESERKMLEKQMESIDKILSGETTPDKPKGKVDSGIPPAIVGATPEELEEFAQKMRVLREKQLAEQKAADEKYRDWKISNNAELLKIEIARLDEEMGLYTERENFDAGRIDDRKRRVEQLADFERAENRAKLEDIIKDTRGWNKKQLQEYAQFLKEQSQLYADNDAMKKEILEKYEETLQKTYDFELEKIREIGDAFRELGDLVGTFDSKLGGMISSVSDITSSIAQMQSSEPGSWGQFAGGIGIAGTVVSTLTNLYSMLSKEEERAADAARKLESEMNKLNTQIYGYNRLWNRAIGTDKMEALSDGINYFTIETKRLKKELDDYALSGNWTLKGYQERVDLWRKSEETLYSAIHEYEEMLTGTTTETIADSITDGLMEGLDSAKVFADTFEDLMKDAMLSAFKRDMITKLLNPFYDTFAELAKGGLTKEEIEELNDLFYGRTLFGKTGVPTGKTPGISEGIKSSFDVMSDFFESMGWTMPGDDKKATGMTGAISGITEETAGLLAGQFNAMRVNTAQTAAGISNIVNYQRRIADNTDYLKSIDIRLMHIESKSITNPTFDYTRPTGGVQ